MNEYRFGVFAGLAMLVAAATEVAANDDRARAGVQVVLGMCTACHGVKYVQYRDLAALGLSSEEIARLRGDNEPGDRIESLTSPGDAQLAYGVEPPDLSLIVAAREGGSRHLYDYLTGYYVDEQGVIENRVYPGTRMPDIFGISAAGDPASRTEIEQSVNSAVAFLEWAADPNKRTREFVGYFVLGYLVLLTFLLYLVKRRIWSTLRQH